MPPPTASCLRRIVGCRRGVGDDSAIGRWRLGMLMLSLFIVLQFLCSDVIAAADNIDDHYQIRRRRQRVQQLSLQQQQLQQQRHQQQQQGSTASQSYTKENSQQLSNDSANKNNSVSQPSNGGSLVTKVGDSSQQQGAASTTKATTPTNLTAINLDEGVPVGSPGSVATTQPPSKSTTTTKSKSTIAPTKDISTRDAPTTKSGGSQSTNGKVTDPPTSANGGSSQGSGKETYPTNAPTMFHGGANGSSKGGETVTKYPEKPDDGSHTPDDETLKPPVTDDETKGPTGGKANNMEEEQAMAEEDIGELEYKLKSEEKEARRIGGAGLGLALIAMIFTAHQMSENPDGIYASCCRLIITLIGCAFKIVLMPCRPLFGAVGGSRHYGHMPVNTMEYGYREPYSNVEMS